jgi:hypothetical protein
VEQKEKGSPDEGRLGATIEAVEREEESKVILGVFRGNSRQALPKESWFDGLTMKY